MHRHRFLTSICAAFLIVIGAVFAGASIVPFEIGYKISKIPVSGKFHITPDRVLASVLILNSESQGSGTIISKGSKYSLILTTAHIFNGKAEGNFWIYFPDGSYSQANLIVVDKDRDLALGAVKSQDILTHSYVPPAIDKSIKNMIGVGYTGGKGPHVKDLYFVGSYYNSLKKFTWEITVTEGPFWNGDSGGGVFVDQALIGVISQRDNMIRLADDVYAKKLYAISHSEIVSFLQANPLDKLEYGDFTIPPPQNKDNIVPPLWRPSPNIPIFIKSLRDKEIQLLQTEIKNIQTQIDELTKVKLDVKSDTVKVDDEKEEGMPLKDLLKKPSDINDTLNK